MVPIASRVEIEELVQPLDPLLEQRLAVHEHERRASAWPRSAGRRSPSCRSRRRAQDAELMGEHRRAPPPLDAAVSSPVNRASSGLPSVRSSESSNATPRPASSSSSGSRHPRGSTRKRPDCSKHAITRGVRAVDIRIAWRSKNCGLENAASRRNASSSTGGSPSLRTYRRWASVALTMSGNSHFGEPLGERAEPDATAHHRRPRPRPRRGRGHRGSPRATSSCRRAEAIRGSDSR